MHVLKRIISFMLLITLLTIGEKEAFYANRLERVVSIDAKGDIISEADAESVMILQENAVLANEQLCREFGCDQYGNVMYPNDYAGAWVDGELLVVALTDISRENVEKYEDLAGEYSKYIRFEEANYSYNYLKSMEESIVAQIESEYGLDVVNYVTSQMNNQIVVGVKVPDDGTSLCSDVEDEFDIPVSIELVLEGDTTTSLIGGADIKNLSTGARFTLTCCGTYNNSPAILTCGHNVSQARGQYIAEVSTGRTIGKIEYRRYTNGGYGDFEIVSVTNTSFTTTSRVLTGDNLVGAIFYPPVNTEVKFYGGSTGRICYGVVTETGVTEELEEGVQVKGLSKVKITSGGVTWGDSGAPFVITSTSGTRLGGLLHGYSAGLVNVYVYFTPYGYIDSAGFDLQTQ